MTSDEFDKWLADYFAAFPNTHSWVDRLEDSDATLRKWERALQGVEFVHAVAATDRIVMGKAAPVDATEYERTPFAIRAIAGRIVDEQRKPVATTEPARHLRRRQFAAGAMYRDLVTRLNRGESLQDAQDAVSREFSTGADPDASPRVACRLCSDTGLVDCWHPVSYVERRQRSSYSVRTCVASCNCKLGSRRREVSRRAETEYDESWMLRYDHTRGEAWNRAQLEAFRPKDPRMDSTLDAWTSDAERHNQEQEGETWV